MLELTSFDWSLPLTQQYDFVSLEVIIKHNTIYSGNTNQCQTEHVITVIHHVYV